MNIFIGFISVKTNLRSLISVKTNLVQITLTPNSIMGQCLWISDMFSLHLEALDIEAKIYINTYLQVFD